MDGKSVKANILNVIEARKKDIIDIGERIYKNPETGFKEKDTSELVAQTLKGMGFNCVLPGDIPGVKVTIDTGREGPGLAILGELDALVCSEHPDCNKETGAIHACGHNIQIAAMLGAAMGITGSGAADSLCGKIHFIAVPAEEYIEVAYRMQLREKGVIRYLGGKPEFLYRGLFDDVDMCIMVHSSSSAKKIAIETSSNGCIVKKIRYIGKASHAGAAPQDGINALYAANLGMMAINSLRETFKEADYIRVHPIITKGGDIVNVIPAEVTAETFVRGKTMDGILNANKKVNRALAGGAIAMGAAVEIEDIPGYYPYNADKNLREIARSVALELLDKDEVTEFGHHNGSTDLGDHSALMPILQPYIGGVVGGLHTMEFRNVDHEASYVLGAKFLACLAVELMKDGAPAAKDVLAKYQPVFKTKEEYMKFADSLFSTKVYSAKQLEV